jgi:hypothetical protein
MLSLKTGFNIFTISEPLAPSIKKKSSFFYLQQTLNRVLLSSQST